MIKQMKTFRTKNNLKIARNRLKSNKRNKWKFLKKPKMILEEMMMIMLHFQLKTLIITEWSNLPKLILTHSILAWLNKITILMLSISICQFLMQLNNNLIMVLTLADFKQKKWREKSKWKRQMALILVTMLQLKMKRGRMSQ
jgi:hypothetical protein